MGQAMCTDSILGAVKSGVASFLGTYGRNQSGVTATLLGFTGAGNLVVEAVDDCLAKAKVQDKNLVLFGIRSDGTFEVGFPTA